jgi:hypothetical protein|tara:strand:+ start:321 stop:530 length:210 start_codon:yes stop_codon:yes gene_type:complete
MTYLRIKRYKENYEVGVFPDKKSKSQYTNILTKDPEIIAIILIDLIIQDLPIQKAIKIMNKKLKNKDWF